MFSDFLNKSIEGLESFVLDVGKRWEEEDTADVLLLALIVVLRAPGSMLSLAIGGSMLSIQSRMRLDSDGLRKVNICRRNHR